MLPKARINPRSPFVTLFDSNTRWELAFRRFCLVLVGCLSLTIVVSADSSANESAPTNIVFLLTDDQATISMGCYGNEDVQTPNLDRLAAAGLVFDSHYVTTAICMASRANIMTGLYEFRTGCNFGRGKMQADQWANSYPMLLRKNGYRTAFAGKFGFEIDGKKDLPAGDFDKWGGGPGQTNFETAKNKSMAAYAEEFPHSTLSYGAFGRDFIRESVSAKQPFCLSISFKAPHRPVQPDPKFDHVYADAKFTKPANFGREHGEHLAAQSKTGRQYPRFEEWGYASDYDAAMQKYNQLVYAVDQAVGMILETLKEQGVADNTIVIFTSDNGYFCGAHGYGSKVLPYEESTRVPLIVYAPGAKNSHGRRTRSLTGNIDFAPTILESAGVDVPAGLDGTSLLPILEDPSVQVRDSLALMNFWGPATAHSFAVVTQQWKYVYWYSQENQMIAAEELFDLSGDRLENTNQVDDDSLLPELNKMRELYDRQVYAIGEQGINDWYRNYSVVFDRKKTWEQKRPFLK